MINEYLFYAESESALMDEGFDGQLVFWSSSLLDGGSGEGLEGGSGGQRRYR